MNKLSIQIRRLITELRKAISSLSSGEWRSLTAASLVFWLASTIFVQIADEVVEKEPIGFDVVVLRFFQSQASPELDPFVVAYSELGGAPLTIVVLVAGLFYLLRRGQRRAAVFLSVSIGGAALINYMFKLLFARTRPDLWETIVTETTYSFPSGHAMISSAVAFSLMFLYWRSKWRWLIVGAGAFYFLSVSVTRLYLGVHYPSDVVAGWCISLAWVLLTASIVLRSAFFGENKKMRG